MVEYLLIINLLSIGKPCSFLTRISNQAPILSRKAKFVRMQSRQRTGENSGGNVPNTITFQKNYLVSTERSDFPRAVGEMQGNC